MSNSQTHEDDFSLKKLFVPLTTFKAIHIIFIVGFLVFGNALFNGFVWDDIGYIIINPELHSLNLSTLLGENVYNTAWFYRPFQPLYFATIYSFFKDTAFFYHLIQITLHVLNASLLFILFKNFFNKQLSLFFSLVFLIHPIQVESVAYIAATGNELFFLFGISALLLSLKKEKSIKKVSFIFGLLFLSVLTRETGILFLIIILLSIAIFNKKYLGISLVFGIIFSLFYLWIRLGIIGYAPEKLQLAPIAWLSFGERLINIPAIIFYYIKTFFFPFELAIDQHWVIRAIDFQHFYFPLIIDISFFSLLGLLGLSIYKSKRRFLNTFIFFLLWFLVGLALHLQIFPLDMTVADRWFYFPMIGLLGIFGVGIHSFKFSQKNIQTIGYIVGIIFIILLSIRTIVRNANWYSNLTLYSHDIQSNVNFDLENNLGIALMNSENTKEALIHLNKSVEMYPYDTNLSNLGVAYARLGNSQKAQEYFFKAIQAKTYNTKWHKHDAATWQNLVRYLITHDDPKAAKKYLKEAIQDYPNNIFFLELLAAADYKLGNRDEALKTAKQAYTLSPNKDTKYIYTQILNNQPIALEEYLKR